MFEDSKREELLSTIKNRRLRDRKTYRVDFWITQVCLWCAIFASLISTILAVWGQSPVLLLAFITAIPGTVIVIDKHFAFAERARWHKLMYLRLDELINEIEYRGMPVEEAAEKFSKLRLEMQNNFPGMSISGLSDLVIKRAN